MKGVNLTERKGAKFENEAGTRTQGWRLATGFLVVLFLGAILWASGAASLLPDDQEDSFGEPAGSRVELTIGTVTLEIIKTGPSYQLIYVQDGKVYRTAVLEDPDGVRYSLEGGPWSEVRLDLLEGASTSHAKEGVSSGLPVNPDFHGPTKYWWDGIRFIKNYPAAYPHPDRDYYHILTKSQWAYYGYRLLHYQIGADYVGTLATIGPVAVGAVIGAIIGSMVAAWIGAIVGTIVGALLVLAFNVVFIDEAGTIWWWINRSLFSALRNIPWWIVWCSPCVQGYIYSHIDYLRVGSFTAYNELGIWGP